MEKEKIGRLIRELKSSGQETLFEPDAKKVLELCSIKVPEFRFAKDMDEVRSCAKELGYPVVLKIVSPDVVHKSDVGGVAIVNTSDDIDIKWSEMVFRIADEKPTTRIEGFLVEKKAAPGVEVIIGAIRDEQFGPAVMFGTGGVAIELMKDVSFRLAPVTMDEALEMMREVKGYPLLEGFRGDNPKDIRAVAEVIVKLSNLIAETDDLREIEINPLIAHECGAIAVDARGTFKRAIASNE